MGESENTLRLGASIVTYRSPLDKLQAAVESFNKIKVNSQLYVVDNHSGPSYSSQLDLIQGIDVIHTGINGGFGFGHNIAIRRVEECDYFLVLNPDVLIHDGTVEAMMSYMDKYPDIGLLAPRVEYANGDLQPLNKRLPSVFDLFARRFLPQKLRDIPAIAERMNKYEMHDVGYDEVVDVPFVSGCFMLFRKSALDAVYGFDEEFFMYLEDCDITRRLNVHGFRSLYLPTVSITHHWARGSHHSFKLMWIMIKSMFHYYRKWGWKWL